MITFLVAVSANLINLFGKHLFGSEEIIGTEMDKMIPLATVGAEEFVEESGEMEGVEFQNISTAISIEDEKFDDDLLSVHIVDVASTSDDGEDFSPDLSSQQPELNTFDVNCEGQAACLSADVFCETVHDFLPMDSNILPARPHEFQIAMPDVNDEIIEGNAPDLSLEDQEEGENQDFVEEPFSIDIIETGTTDTPTPATAQPRNNDRINVGVYLCEMCFMTSISTLCLFVQLYLLLYIENNPLQNEGVLHL